MGNTVDYVPSGGSTESRANQRNPVRIIEVQQTFLESEVLDAERRRLAQRVIDRFGLPSTLLHAEFDLEWGILSVHGGRPGTPAITSTYRAEPGEVWNIQVGGIHSDSGRLIAVNKIVNGEQRRSSTPLRGSAEAVAAIDRAFDDLLSRGSVRRAKPGDPPGVKPGSYF